MATSRGSGRRQKRQRDAGPTAVRARTRQDAGSAANWYQYWQQRELERRKREGVFQKNWYASQGEAAKQHQSPWLLIRYNNTDLGSRPILPGNVFWESPDIWVESSDPLGQPVAGEADHVHARIFNLGAFDAAPVVVDFYWANPAIGFASQNANFIGREFVEIPTLTHQDVRCSRAWTPVYINEGHECLVINCSNPILDPIIQPFKPIADRHVGQRNVHVVTATAGQVIKFPLELNNLSTTSSRVAITAEVKHLSISAEGLRLLAAGHRALMNQIIAFDAQDPNTATRTIRLVTSSAAPTIGVEVESESRFVIATAPGEFGTGKLHGPDFPEGSAYSGCMPGLELAYVTLLPSEQRAVTVTLGIPNSADLGDHLIFRLAQKQEGGIPVGGYAIVVNVTE